MLLESSVSVVTVSDSPPTAVTAGWMKPYPLPKKRPDGQGSSAAGTAVIQDLENVMFAARWGDAASESWKLKTFMTAPHLNRATAMTYNPEQQAVYVASFKNRRFTEGEKVEVFSPLDERNGTLTNTHQGKAECDSCCLGLG